MVISQKLERIQSQNWNFLEVNSIYFKIALFFARSTRQGASHPITSGAAASSSQRSELILKYFIDLF